MKACVSIVLLLASLASASASGQALFRAGVEAIEVDVSVMRGGRPVAGLSADNFVLTDNGIRQQVSVTTLSDVPLRVALTLDVSNSVRGRRLERLVAASNALANALGPDDQISLIAFSHQVRMLVPMGRPEPRFRETLAQLRGGGPTALRDAVQLAMATQADRRTRSLVLLFSDGSDTASWTPVEMLLASARQSNSVIHAVRFLFDFFLDRLTDATGGRTWSAGSDADLEALFTGVLQEMRARYVLNYTPQEEQKRGWHEIKVSLKDARGDVTARPGYVVP